MAKKIPPQIIINNFMSIEIFMSLKWLIPMILYTALPSAYRGWAYLRIGVWPNHRSWVTQHVLCCCKRKVKAQQAETQRVLSAWLKKLLNLTDEIQLHHVTLHI